MIDQVDQVPMRQVQWRWGWAVVAACVLWLGVVPQGWASEGGSAEPSVKRLSQEDRQIQKVLQRKDAHALWLLMARGGYQTVSQEGGSEMPVHIQTARALIESWSRSPDYQASVKQFLTEMGLPRDWGQVHAKTIDQLQAKHPDGLVVQTRHYRIFSMAGEEMTQKLGRRMDAIYRLYGRVLSLREKIPYKCLIVYWRDQQQYMDQGAPAGSVAYYQPGTKMLVGYDTQASPDTRHMDPFEVMYHEGWHQYFDFYIPGAPRWFDEGFALVFETTQVRRGQARLGSSPGTMRYVQYLAAQDALIPLDELLQMEHRPFMERAQVAYPQSYSFVRFLMNGDSGTRLINRYFRLLRDGVDAHEAADQVFTKDRLELLDGAWRMSLDSVR